MSIYNLPLLLSLFLSLGLGLFVFIKGRRRETSAIFFIMCLCLVMLNLIYLMNNSGLSPRTALLQAKFGSLWFGLMYPTFFHFTLLITKQQSLIKRQYHHLAYLFVLIFIFMGIFQIKEMVVYPWGYLPGASIFLHLYHILLAFILISSLYFLYRGQDTLFTKRDKVCARYLFWGGVVAALSSMVNFLPFFGIGAYPFGQTGLTLYLVLIAWVILRYRLIGAEVVFKGTFLFSLMSGLVMAIFMLSVFLFEREGSAGFLSPAVTASIIIAFVFQPLRERVDSLTNRVFFRGVRHREEMLHKLREILTSTYHPDLLLNYLADTLQKTIKIEKIAIILVAGCGLSQKEDVVLKEDDPIIDYLKKHGILNDYDLEEEPSLRNSDGPRAIFERLGTDILVPVIFRERVLAILSLGEKTVGLTYTAQEIEFLKATCREAAIALENIRLFEDMRRQLLGAVKALISAVESKDIGNFGHADRVAEFSGRIADRMRLSSERITNIKTGASLHDIGKINIPDQILKKSEELAPEEWHQVKSHPEKGYEIISPVRFPEDVLDAVKYHHERFDGGGYPYGLKGENIPLSGRIVACANTYDAIVSDHPYRTAKSHQEAMAIIKKHSGEWFDPRVVEAFLQILEEGVRP